jgi:hypothetical protein
MPYNGYRTRQQIDTNPATPRPPSSVLCHHTSCSYFLRVPVCLAQCIHDEAIMPGNSSMTITTM